MKAIYTFIKNFFNGLIFTLFSIYSNYIQVIEHFSNDNNIKTNKNNFMQKENLIPIIVNVIILIGVFRIEYLYKKAQEENLKENLNSLKICFYVFIRSCSFELHNNWTNEILFFFPKETIIKLAKNKKIEDSEFQELIKNNIISQNDIL